MSDLKTEMAKELSDVKAERESSEKEITKMMNEFASELKKGMGEDIKETLSRSEAVEEEKKKHPDGAIKKIFRKIVRICR